MSHSPEIMVCDTSFVSHIRARLTKPERFQHWDTGVVARIDRAIKAISVVTLAEVRFGYLKASWGPKLKEESERRLATYLQIPLDFPVLDEWARLRNCAKQRGLSISHNDLWIAATANTRSHPLVTCDKDQARLNDEMQVPVIFLPPHSPV